MTFSRKAALAPVLALGLLLGGCGGSGGGGLVSAPGPVDEPGQAPPTAALAPAISLAAGVEDFENPYDPVLEPGPIEPTNDDLLGPLESGRFDMVGLTAIEERDANYGESRVKVMRGPYFFEYDAEADAYLVGRDRIAFGPDDLRTSTGSAAMRTYIRETETVASSLVLSEADTQGRFTYRYVGTGFLRSLIESDGFLRSEVAQFVYGNATEAADMPTLGSARYSVDLLAVLVSGGEVSNLYGEGQLRVNFDAGSISGEGLADQFDAAGDLQKTRRWRSSAEIEGSAFSAGIFDIAGLPYSYWGGAFFGPDAEEVGSVFNAINEDASQSLNGTLTGRRD